MVHLKSKYEKKVIPKDLLRFYECVDIEYTVKKKYKPDLAFPRLSNIVLELKGYFSPTDRAKMLAVKRENPKLDIRLIFQYNNKINKTSSTRYTDWCDKHGFKWFVGNYIPREWLKEIGLPVDKKKESKEYARPSYYSVPPSKRLQPSKGNQ